MPTSLRATVTTVLCGAIAFAACSSDGSSPSKTESRRTSTSSSSISRPAGPAGPAARNAGELAGGKGVNLAAATAVPLADGWVEAEFAVDGVATSYASAGELPADGSFALQPAETADYRTRIVVRRPERPADFNGTVLVEWLNVSGGLDANPDYTYLSSLIEREGYAWVGVSAQRIGIEGGPVAVSVPAAEAAGAGRGLKALDPERYGELAHPGDAFSYDMYTQVARALRSPDEELLGTLTPKRVLAIGESQSAFMLTTYVNGVQPLTRVFDGFLIHSRGGAAAPLGEPGTGIDIAGTIGLPSTRIRTDGSAPVMVVETETDILGVLNAFPARQPDAARLRWWEIAGAAHADRFIVGALADSFDCGAPVNDGPGRFPVRAALAALDRWVRTGAAPPKAPRLEVDATPQYVRDDTGNALGGIRSPHVDAPVAVHSGASPGTSVVCILFGSSQPLTDAQLQARYPSRAEYLQDHRAAVDAMIDAGFALPADRAELMGLAEPERIPE